MRVLWLIRGLGPGGAERLLVAQASLAASGIEYEVAYQRPDKDQLVGELTQAGVIVHLLPSGRQAPLALRRLVADRQIDVVHSHSPLLGAIARIVLRIVPGGRRPALVYTEHNAWGAYRRATRWANALTQRVEDHVLAVSSESRRSIHPLLRGRVEALHHGIDGEGVRAAATTRGETRLALGLDEQTAVFVQVANLRPEKAHEVMIEAATSLHDVDRPEGPPIRILLAGQGPRLDEVRSLVASAGVDDVMTVLGFRSDVASLLAASEALVLSSDHEGLPVAVMEAFALGVPVVSTSVGGIPEAVTDGIEGLLVPARDPQALADAVRQVAEDPDLRRRLAEGARARSVEFDVRTASARIETIYAEAWAARQPWSIKTSQSS